MSHAARAIGQQLGAAIETLEAVVAAYPDALWRAGEKWHQPWYVAFHTTFWLHLYLSETAEYEPPAPFTRGELEPDVFPDRIYAPAELQPWLAQGHPALESRLEALAAPGGEDHRVVFPWREWDRTELLLYNLRHVQHHAGQLNALLRRGGAEPAAWVSRRERPAR